jgi:hypothetical protein
MCTCNCPTPLQVYTTHIHGSNVCCPVHMLLGIYAARRTCCNSRRATDSVASVHYPYTRQQRMLPGAYAARHICCTAHMLLGAYAATVGAQQSAAAVATLDNISSSSRRRQQQWQHRRRRGHLYTYMLILLVMDIYIYKTFIYIYIYICQRRLSSSSARMRVWCIQYVCRHRVYVYIPNTHPKHMCFPITMSRS